MLFLANRLRTLSMSTGIGHTFRTLGELVAAIEAGGGSVECVDAPADGLYADGAVTVDLDVRLPFLDASAPTDADVTVESATVDDDGALRLRLVAAGTTEPPTETSAVDGEAAPAGTRDDAESAATEDDGAAARPAYRDPERLRAAYAAHDSFPAMTEALGVDVTPQTVRRHMIKHGIHDPAGSTEAAAVDPAAGEDAGEPAADDPEPDGGEPVDQPSAVAASPAVERVLGEDVSVEGVKAAVRDSRTIREVAQRLDIPRERAFRLLNALDLVDLVSGRLETADHPVSAEELDRRLARAAAGGE